MNSQAARKIVSETSNDTVRKKRFLLFLTAYLVSVLSATGLIIDPMTDSSSFVLSTLITFLFLLSFLPCGLVFAIDGILTVLGLDGSRMETGLLFSNGLVLTSADVLPIIFAGISYMLCFLIPILGSAKSKQRIFGIFFLAFVSLLIVSIAGWVTIQ